jgi:hypothetical protein
VARSGESQFVLRLGLIISTGILGASAAWAADAMVPRDIQSTFFTGEPFTATSPSGTKYKMTFAPDGKMTREPVEPSGTKDTGTWKLSANGFCTTWTRSKPNCFIVTPIGDNKWSVEKIATTIATRVAVWSK